MTRGSPSREIPASKMSIILERACALLRTWTLFVTFFCVICKNLYNIPIYLLLLFYGGNSIS